MYPYLFSIPLPWGGSYAVRSYGFMIMCGFLLCLWLLRGRARRMGMNPLHLFDTVVLALLCGILGARLLYVVRHWGQFSEHLLDIVRLDKGGLSFFGGLLGGAGGLLYGVFTRGLPLLPALDVAVSLVPLGHAFGRVGCFLFGCCYGRLTDLWVGVRFPRFLEPGKVAGPLLRVDGETIVGSPVFIYQRTVGWTAEAADHIRQTFSRGLVKEFDGATEFIYPHFRIVATRLESLPVHPTQLYAVGYNLIIFAALSILLWRRRRPGDIAWTYALFYGTARFCNQFFRADVRPLDGLGGLTVFHLVAGALAVFGASMLVRSRRLPAVPMPEPWQEPDKGQ